MMRSNPALPLSVFLSLCLATFASSAALRMCDPILPMIAGDFHSTPGSASIIITAYAVGYGLLQLVYGPLGDRHGRYRLILMGALMAGFVTMAGASSGSLEQLALWRLLSGVFAAAITPNALAFIGDVVPFEQRQATLARFMVAMTAGVFCGQVIGGLMAEHWGWRMAFIAVGASFLAAGLVMAVELRRNRAQVDLRNDAATFAKSFASLADLPRLPLARLVLVSVVLETLLFFGPYTMVGSDLHQRFGLAFDTVGLYTSLTSVATVVYGLFAARIIARVGEINLIGIAGAAFAAGFALLTLATSLTLVPLAILLMGLGFVLLHNCLQANATQMHPSSRGTGVAAFASMFYLGQMVALPLVGFVFDHYGARPIYVVAMVGLPLLALWFRSRLRACRGPAVQEP